MGRGGVRSADEAIDLAEHLTSLSGLRFRGEDRSACLN